MFVCRKKNAILPTENKKTKKPRDETWLFQESSNSTFCKMFLAELAQKEFLYVRYNDG
jgi:hypothetical protein